MNLKDLDKNLQLEFFQKRINADSVAYNNRRKASMVPSYLKFEILEKEIQLELSKTNKKPSNKLLSSLKLANTERLKILKEIGLSESDLKPKYECVKCSDTGFVSGKMCDCYKKRRNQEIIKICGLDVDNNNLNLEQYTTSICNNLSHAEKLEKLKNNLIKWAEKFPDVKKLNILLSGTPGGGKTYITQCLANQMLKKGYSVCFVSAFDMNNMFLKYHTTFDKTKNSYLDPFLNSDVLFVDDLGTEPIMKNVTINYLFLILSERERFKKPMIVSTNLLPEHILDRYGERIYSRLNNKLSSMVFFLDGDDLRIR